MPLSVQKQWEIIFLSQHKYGPHFSNNKIAKELRVDKKVIAYWLKIYRETGDIVTIKESGRPRVTSKNQDDKIITTQLKNREQTGSQLMSKLKRKKVDVSYSTAWRRLHEAGLKFRTVTVKPLLTEEHRRKRLEWALKNLRRDWNNVLFTDEATLKLFYHKSKTWHQPGERVVVRTVKHPAKCHVWGCMSANGFGDIFIFTSNLNAKKLCYIYGKALLPSAKRLFTGPWVLQEDNDPKHKYYLATKWREDNGVKRMDWPAQSPDQNCIEHVWKILKSNVASHHPTSLKQLIRFIRKEWENLPSNLAAKLVENIPRRLNSLIGNKGDYTLY